MVFNVISFYFFQLLFSKITEQSKWRLINVLNGFSQCFGNDMFHFLTTLIYDLVDPVMCNIIDIVCSCLYQSRSDFCCLVNNISPCVGKVVAVKKTSKLRFSFSVCTSVSSFGLIPFFFVEVSYLNFKYSDSMTRNPRGLFFLISKFLQKTCSKFLPTKVVFCSKCHQCRHLSFEVKIQQF